MSAQIN